MQILQDSTPSTMPSCEYIESSDRRMWWTYKISYIGLSQQVLIGHGFFASHGGGLSIKARCYPQQKLREYELVVVDTFLLISIL